MRDKAPTFCVIKLQLLCDKTPILLRDETLTFLRDKTPLFCVIKHQLFCVMKRESLSLIDLHPNRLLHCGYADCHGHHNKTKDSFDCSVFTSYAYLRSEQKPSVI